MNRRFFLQTALGTALASPVAAASYGVFESTWLKVDRQKLPLPRLPVEFDGTTVAFLTDIHHGPFTSIEYITDVVRTTRMLQPDLIVLGGDYSLRDSRFVGPCFEALQELDAPMGIYGVLGNHDYWHGLKETKQGFTSARVQDLTNRGVWFERRGARFRLAGVDDMWAGKRDLKAALGDASAPDACLLVSHNPDVAETLRDPRVGLMLSGHTHGGQVLVPGMGAPFVPSHYGSKYLKGFVQAPVTNVYVSRGLGLVGGPIRVGSRPELTLITLKSV